MDRAVELGIFFTSILLAFGVGVIMVLPQKPDPRTKALQKIAQDGIECRINTNAPMPPEVE